MFTFRGRLDDIGAPATITGETMAFGESGLAKFPSPMLVFETVQEDAGRSIWIGEDRLPACISSGPGVSERVRGFSDYGGVLIRLVGGQGSPVGPEIEISRTEGGTSPLYLATCRSWLVASWMFEDAVGVLPRPEPNVDICRIYAKYSQARTRDQIIRGVHMLWPGEAARFNAAGLAFQEMSPSFVQPSVLVEDARASDRFMTLLAESMARQLARSKRTLLEVSGGFDSSCVAIAAASRRERLSSYGVVQPGVVGDQQRKRRSELVGMLGLRDHEGPATHPLPTRSLSERECRVTPYDDLYRMPCMNAAGSHPDGPFDLVLSGIGGDELTKEDTFRVEEWEVQGVACSSAIVAAVSRADMFMRRGVWPLNPLVHNEVIGFCRALPAALRRGRMLNVLALARAGLSDGFLFPRYHEHFGAVLSLESIEVDYDQLFRESLLADYGIADVRSTLQEARDATLVGMSWRLVSKLYNLAKLEYTLRTHVAGRPTVPADRERGRPPLVNASR